MSISKDYMHLLITFISMLNVVIFDESIQHSLQTKSKYMKLVSHINGNESEQSKWIRILHYIQTTDVEDEKTNRLLNKWIIIAQVMTTKGDRKMYEKDGVIYMELSSKLNAIVFKDNSAILTRKIAGSTVVNSMRIADIYDVPDATKILYLANESNAYDVITKIRKTAEKLRLKSSFIEEDDGDA